MKYRLEESLDSASIAAVDQLSTLAPNAHFTQHPAWAGVPADDASGRWLHFVGDEEGRARVAALMRVRRAPVVGSVLADVFRGPMADSPAALAAGVAAMQELLAPRKPLAIRLDPFWSDAGSEEVGQDLARLGYTEMPEPFFGARSLEVAIDREPEDLLQSFRKETRYDVRKALKLELDVREDLDDAGLAAFESLYAQMTETKGASPRPAGFFRGVRDLFRAWPKRGFFLASWHEGELLGAIAIFTLGRRAIYGYGASSRSHPGVPKTHLLHYEAMRRARARGCAVYDMGGFGAGVGAGSAEERTHVQKINYFKTGFGGREVDFVAARERIFKPLSYRLLRSASRLLS